jgi:hypothetical protein
LIRHALLRMARPVFPLAIAVIESAFGTLLMTTIGAASLIQTGLAAAMHTAIALPTITMRAEEERCPAFTAQTNPQPQNHFAMNRHPTLAGRARQRPWLRGTLDLANVGA